MNNLLVKQARLSDFEKSEDEAIANQKLVISFDGDGIEYDVLYYAAVDVATSIMNNVFQDPVISFCEIGVRRGLGSVHMIQGILKTLSDEKSQVKKEVVGIGVDPYGNIGYNPVETVTNVMMDYTNKMRNSFLKNIYTYAYCGGFNYLFFNLEDAEFFKRYSDGVPFYSRIKYMITKFHLVYFDGPHTLDAVMNETVFFHDRSCVGSIFVYDNINSYETPDPSKFTHSLQTEFVYDEIDKLYYGYYNHSIVERWLIEHGWIIFCKKISKISYKRIN